MNEEWFDISLPLRTGMIHWPGDPEPILERLMEMERGDSLNLTFMRMSAHTGTHVDAPVHFLANGCAMEQFPLDAGIGPVRVVDVAASTRIGPTDLAPHGLARGERLLLKTSNSARRLLDGEFCVDYAHVTAAGARYLAESGIRLVGIDALSIGACDEQGEETHRILLRAGVWILEGLDLAAVEPGNYDLYCLPLRMEGADGAPARAVLRRRAAAQ